MAYKRSKPRSTWRDRYEWLAKTPHGDLTAKQEFFCWRYALHGNGSKAFREVFDSHSLRSQGVGAIKLLKHERIVYRIKELIHLHNEKKVDLHVGPWEFYGRADFGTPDRKNPARINNYVIATGEIHGG